MYLTAMTPSEAIELITKYIIQNGEEVAPRDQKTLEILNATIEVTEPWHIPLGLENRKLNQNIGFVEALQLVGQTASPEKMIETSKVFYNYMDDEILYGSYGPRIYGNLSKVVNLLKKDPSSRQAILTIFDSDKDLNQNLRDIPCTLSLQYFIRNDKLIARTSMRSNDIYLGLPYDFVQFIALQGAIAKALDLEMGSYFHTVGSMHIYEKDIDAAKWIKTYFNGGFKNYEPLWSGESIGEISSNARKLLNGLPLDHMTTFEDLIWNTRNNYLGIHRGQQS